MMNQGEHTILIVKLNLKSSLCNYSDANILVKGSITVDNIAADGAANNTNAPFTNCIIEINNTQVDNAKDIDKVMPVCIIVLQRREFVCFI